MYTCINNTDEFMVGDIIISFPNNRNIHRDGYEYAIRRFEVVGIDYEKDVVILYDLDNGKTFTWDFHMLINKDTHNLFVVANVFN